MRLFLKRLTATALLIMLLPLCGVGWLVWYGMDPTFPVPSGTMHFQSEPRFGGPDHQDAWISFDMATSPETIIAFYERQGANCGPEAFGVCEGKTFLGRAHYKILKMTRVSATLIHVEAYMHWSSF